MKFGCVNIVIDNLLFMSLLISFCCFKVSNNICIDMFY